MDCHNSHVPLHSWCTSTHFCQNPLWTTLRTGSRHALWPLMAHFIVSGNTSYNKWPYSHLRCQSTTLHLVAFRLWTQVPHVSLVPRSVSTSSIRFIRLHQSTGYSIPQSCSLSVSRIVQKSFPSLRILIQVKILWEIYYYYLFYSPAYQLPFYIMTLIEEKDPWRNDLTQTWPAICTFLAFTQCFITPALYGASLFMIKEEDMALSARTHKTNPQYQHIPTHSLQAQLI